MMTPEDIYVYKLIADNGGAPCVYRGMLSLAICKPKIRKTAEVGALVMGFGGKRLGGRLIYAAYVTEKPPVGEYYTDTRFHHRPDCIYRAVNGRPERIEGAQFHAGSDESPTDVGSHFEKAHVLLSKDFCYFGAAGKTDYQATSPALTAMLARLKRGHRLNHDAEVRKELCALAKQLWRNGPAGKVAEPSDADRSRRCNTDAPSAKCSG